MALSNREKLELVKEWKLRQARRDFYAFRQLIHPQNAWGWWTAEVSAALQQYYRDLKDGLKPRLLIQAPPQHGKSALVTDFITWLSGKDPDIRVIYASFSERLGVRANKTLQRLFDSTVYREIFPDLHINDSNVVTLSSKPLRNSEIIEYAGRSGYFRNTTVGGSITGESLDLGVIDDPVKGRKEANSQTVRDSVWNWFTDDFSTRFSEQAGLLAIMTRWHIDDPMGRLQEQDGSLKVLSYPAIAEHDEPHRRKGEALFPEHKSLAFLEGMRDMMPSGNWQALYQQHPTVEEGGLFKPDSMARIHALPAGEIRWIRAWDLASTSDGGDYTAGAKLGALPDGRYIIAHMVRGQYDTHIRDEILHKTAQADGRKVRISLPQDPGAAGKAQILYLTRQLAGFAVKSSPESGDKTTRAEPFAAQVNVGNVLVLDDGTWDTAALVAEMRLFPNGKHDDQIDALSRAFNELVRTGGEVKRVDFRL